MKWALGRGPVIVWETDLSQSLPVSVKDLLGFLVDMSPKSTTSSALRPTGRRYLVSWPLLFKRRTCSSSRLPSARCHAAAAVTFTRSALDSPRPCAKVMWCTSRSHYAVMQGDRKFRHRANRSRNRNLPFRET